MDLGKSSTQGQASKAQRVGNTASDLKPIIAILGKLTLNNAQQSRMLRAILITCFRIESGNDVVSMMQEATRNFATKAKELRDSGMTSDAVRTELASPAVHSFNALLQHTITAKDLDKNPKIVAFRAYYNLKGVQELARYVRHFKVAKMFDKKVIRIEVNLSEIAHPEDMPKGTPDPRDLYLEFVLPHIQSLKGYCELPGVAPPGDLERQIQEWLDNN